MDIRYIHTADLHIDSPLIGLAAYEDAPLEKLRGATREAFTGLVTYAIKEKVAFVVIAGDAYDGTWKDFSTGIYMARELGRLEKAQIQVYLLFGNHDAESELTKNLTLPPNVHTFNTKKPQTFTLQVGEHHVALHGQSFKIPHVTDNLVDAYPAPLSGHYNIGVLHTGLEGLNKQHANYAPCSLAQLETKGYDAWTLGHIHQYQVLLESPFVSYSGNLQGRHAKETGARGFNVISVDAGKTTHERVHTDVLRWQRYELDVSTVTSQSDLATKARERLERALIEDADGLPMVARITLKGRTALHSLLIQKRAVIDAELRAAAASLGTERLWIERIILETQPLEDATTLAARDDAAGALMTYIKQAASDAGLKKDVLETLNVLASKAPAELGAEVPELELIRTEDIAALVANVQSDLVAILTGGAT